MLKTLLLICFIFNTFSSIASIGDISPLLHLLDFELLEVEDESLQCDQQFIFGDKSKNADCLTVLCSSQDQRLPIKNRLLDSGGVYVLEEDLIGNEDAATLKNKQELEKKIKKYFSLRKNNSIDNLSTSEIKASLERINKEQSSSDSFGVYANSIFIKTIEKHLNTFFDKQAKLDKETLEISLDTDLMKSIEDQSKTFHSFLQDYQRWMNREGRMAERAFDPEAFIAWSYPQLTLEDGIREYISKISRIRKELEKFSPFLQPFGLNDQLLLNKLESGTLTNPELKILLSQGFEVEKRRQIKSLLDGSNDRFINNLRSNLIDKMNTITGSSRAELIGRVIELSKEHNAHLEFEYETYSEEAVDECLSAYENSLNLLPTKREIDSLKVLASEAKRNYIQSLSKVSGLSTTSKPILESLLSEIEMSMPYSADEWLSMVNQNIDQYITSEERLALVARADAIDGIVKGAMLAQDQSELMAAITRSVPDSNYLNGLFSIEENFIANVCENLEQQPFSDAILTATDKIMVSFTTALLRPLEAKGLLYHEFSHSLERHLENGVSFHTNRKYETNKNCLIEIQSHLGIDSDHYFSEDFADYMTSKLLPELKRSFLCEAIYFDESTGSYLSQAFKNQNPKDNHSSISTRLIRHRVDRGESLPQVCSEALAKEGIFSVGESCEF